MGSLRLSRNIGGVAQLRPVRNPFAPQPGDVLAVRGEVEVRNSGRIRIDQLVVEVEPVVGVVGASRPSGEILSVPAKLKVEIERLVRPPHAGELGHRELVAECAVDDEADDLVAADLRDFFCYDFIFYKQLVLTGL